MKVAFITPSVSRSSGGIFEVELALAKSLTNISCEVQVYGQQDENTQFDLPKWGTIKVDTYPALGPHAFRYSPALSQALKQSSCDIAHLQVIWMYTSVATNNWSKTGKPYLVTIHGMLEPWALQNARWKKKLVALLYENKCLHNATCIHAHTHKEYLDIRQYGLKNPVCIIPNGVDLPDLNNAVPKPAWHHFTNGRKVLLFISRLHPKKGIENLLAAWGQAGAEKKDWCLVIAGWGDEDYSQSLVDKAKSLGLEQDVLFAGPQFEEEKHRTFRHADAFILPSFSEGLPMAVLEAWSYQMPVLITPACNVPEGYERQAAIKIEPNPSGVGAGLNQLFQLSDNDRKNMGQRGYQLVTEKFTWDKIAYQMDLVYKWLVNKTKHPDTVLFD